MASHEPIPGLRKIPDNLPPLLRPPGALPGEEARERFWNLVAIMLVVAIALVATGWWSYGQVRQSLRDLRSAGLAALIEAESGVLTVWVDEKKRAAERGTTDEPGQREAAVLVGLVRAGKDAAEVCRSTGRQKLLAQIAPFVALEEAVAVNLIGRDGAIINASIHTVVGGLSAGGLAAAYTGFCYPNIFGNVLAQSAALWWRPESENEPEWLSRQFARSPRLPLRFYLEVGLLIRRLDRRR